jgi:hypothetical protein
VPDGVVEDVVERGVVLLLGLDHLRPEAAAEDVILPAVSLVEGARVLAIEVAHARGEVGDRRFDDEVVVVAEQAAGVETPAVAPPHASQDLHEDRAVPVVGEDRVVVVPLRADVVVGAGFEVAERPSHAGDGSRPGVPNRRRADSGTEPQRTRYVPGKKRRRGRRGRKGGGRSSGC